MDLYTINKKRKFLCAISLLTTTLIIALYVLSIILFARASILVPIVGAVLIMVILYFFSSLYVMKKYMTLKTCIINMAIKNDIKAKEIVYLEEKNQFLENFYKKDSINIKSKVNIIYEDFNIKMEEFEISEKRDFKSNKIVSAGKHLSFDLNILSDDVCFIKNNEKETNKYIDYYSYIFKKKDDSVYLNNKKTYTCLFNNKVNSKLLNIFDKINNFHMLSMKDNKVDIIFLDTTVIFDFKLQQNITTQTVNNCNACFNKTIKLINMIRKGEF